MALGRSGRALERLLGGLQTSAGGLGEVSGVMLALNMVATYRKKCSSKTQEVLRRVFDRFCKLREKFVSFKAILFLFK